MYLGIDVAQMRKCRWSERVNCIWWCSGLILFTCSMASPPVVPNIQAVCPLLYRYGICHKRDRQGLTTWYNAERASVLSGPFANKSGFGWSCIRQVMFSGPVIRPGVAFETRRQIRPDFGVIGVNPSGWPRFYCAARFDSAQRRIHTAKQRGHVRKHTSSVAWTIRSYEVPNIEYRLISGPTYWLPEL